MGLVLLQMMLRGYVFTLVDLKNRQKGNEVITNSGKCLKDNTKGHLSLLVVLSVSLRSLQVGTMLQLH